VSNTRIKIVLST